LQLDDHLKNLLRELGHAINDTVSESDRITGAIAGVRAHGYDIVLKLDAKAREWLADKGYDPAYGARPLKRVIQKAVQDPLSELILSGKVKDGETVAISAGKAGLTFNDTAVAQAA